MDARLLHRFRDGDPEAALAIQRELRLLAMAVLGEDGFGLDDPAALRLLSSAVVTEVLERRARDADSLMVATIMGAARRGVAKALKGGASQEGHVPTGVLVSVALVPDAMAGPARKVAEAHLASCADCTALVRQVRDATSVAIKMMNGEMPEATGAPMEGGAAGPLDGSESLREAAREEADKILETMKRPRPRSADREPPIKRARTARRSRRDKEPGRRRLTWGLATFSLVAAAMVVLALPDCTPGEEAPPVLVPSIAELAVQVSPPGLPAEGWEGLAAEAHQDLQAGRCHLAASRFRKARFEDPSHGQIWFYEGLAALCAGDPEAALAALEGAEAQGGRGGELVDLSWYMAQAALELGDIRAAHARLGEACRAAGGAHREEACRVALDLEERAREAEVHLAGSSGGHPGRRR